MAQMRVTVNRLRNNMVIAKDVYTNTGIILIAEGTPVTKEVVSLLTKHFIDSVIVDYVTVQNDFSLPPQEAPRPTTEQQFQEFKASFQIAEDTLSKNIMDIVYHEEDIDTEFLLRTLNSIVEKADNETDLSHMLRMMKSSSEGLYQHSIGVAILGQILAKWLRCSKEELELISLAGLLHDIGILKTYKNKMAHFSFHGELENSDNARHAIDGYNAIRNQNIDERIKQAVLTHHERLDGSGFPLKVSHPDINKISKILAIVDTYDILTMKENGFEAMSPFLALRKMEEIGYNKLDSHFLTIFLSNISNTMIQHRVLLNNGQEGRVIMINKYEISRPLIQVGNAFIDLSKKTDIFIQDVLD